MNYSSDFHSTLYKLIISQLKYDAAADNVELNLGLQSVKASNCLSLTLYDWYKSVGMFQNVTQKYQEELPVSPASLAPNSPLSPPDFADFSTALSAPTPPVSSCLNPLSTPFISQIPPTNDSDDEISMLDGQVFDNGLNLSDVDLNYQIMEWQTELLFLKKSIVMQEDPMKVVEEDVTVDVEEDSVKSAEEAVSEVQDTADVDENNVPTEEVGRESEETDEEPKDTVEETESQDGRSVEAETCEEDTKRIIPNEQVQTNEVVVNTEEAKEEAIEAEPIEIEPCGVCDVIPENPETESLEAGSDFLNDSKISQDSPVPTFVAQLYGLSRKEIQSIISILAQGWKSRKQTHKRVVKSIPRSRNWNIDDILLATFGDRDAIDANVEEMKKNDFIRLKKGSQAMKPNDENSNTINKAAQEQVKEKALTKKGILIKHHQPKDAMVPTTKWRLCYFKEDSEPLPTVYIHTKSVYLIGRERKVADILANHPSCSSQHAVIQFRQEGGIVKPYLMDLESTNGTFLNNEKIKPRSYYQLRDKDVLRFGCSTRYYVLLHEQSGDAIPMKSEVATVEPPNLKETAEALVKRMRKKEEGK